MQPLPLHKLKHHLINYKILYSIIIIFSIFYYFSLSKTLFTVPYSTVLTDANSELLGARVASDGQWRFPPNDTLVSDKYQQCVVAFEDRYFYRHPGINPVSMYKAFWRNIRKGKVVSGGSTLSMQVIRLHRKNKRRTIWEKLVESVLATRLELRYSKDEILSKYYNHAPFGGNIVGIQAASWRFFGRSPYSLSWAEAALLAVLPNSPSYIHVNKNRQKLLSKRNRLLLHLKETHKISLSDYQLALLEPLPDKLIPLPNIVPHLADKINSETGGKNYKVTLSKSLQENVGRLVTEYMSQLLPNKISNACVLVIDVKTMQVKAYVANVPKSKYLVDGQDVDLIQSARSTGSILKPLLYAAIMSEGAILPETLIPDIPTVIGGFKPENYSNGYEGAVPAKLALSRSLNIPSVRLLQQYGIPKFQNYLTNLGISTLVYPPDHYGLTLVVGGAEGKLWDIAGVYAKMAYTLNHFNQFNRYPDSIPLPHYNLVNIRAAQNAALYKQLDAGSIFLTFKALLEVNRPDEESGWVQLGSSRAVAWKTGTSYGFRDAWAVGTTPGYVVGVWVGNADGEGRPGLTGVGAAAPLMFRVFSALPSTRWFQTPFDELEKVEICRLSGYKATDLCLQRDSIYIARRGIESSICPYHVRVHLSSDRKYRVNSECYPQDKIINEPWFVLPPAMEWFYRKKNLFYKPLPPEKSGCTNDDRFKYMEFIYPSDFVKIFIPRGFDGSKGEVVFEVAHRNPNATLFWHIDNQYQTTTHYIHQLARFLEPGLHTITVVDDEGRSLTRKLEVLDKK